MQHAETTKGFDIAEASDLQDLEDEHVFYCDQ